MKPQILPLPAPRGRRPGIILRPDTRPEPSYPRCDTPDCYHRRRAEVAFPEELYAQFGLAPAGFCGVKCVAEYNWRVLMFRAAEEFDREDAALQPGPMVSNTLPHSKETPCPTLRPPHVLTLPPPRLLPPHKQ